MDDIVDINLERENSKDSKTDSDDFDQDFEEIKIDSSIQLKQLKKINVTLADSNQKEPSFTVNVIFQASKDAQEYQKVVIRKYSEFQWLDAQLQKSFPGWLIPSLPTLYDINHPFSSKVTKEVDSLEIVKDLSYTYNDYTTVSNYVAQVLSNERFRNFIKLKEFISNSEEIKNIANMDSDDPQLSNKIFKFFKFTGKSILNYAWSGEKQKTQASEEKGKNSVDSLINENKSPEDITWMLNLAKAGINSQVYTINELWTNILNLIKRLWQMSTKSIDTPEEEKCNSFKLFSESGWSLHKIYDKLCSSWKLMKLDVNELVSQLKVNVYVSSRKLLSKYKNAVRAIDRLLSLSSDVSDLYSMISKYKNEANTQDMYQSEYQHYLNLLRVNFTYLLEDTKKMQKKEEKLLKSIIEEFYKAQKMYVMLLSFEWTQITNI